MSAGPIASLQIHCTYIAASIIDLELQIRTEFESNSSIKNTESSHLSCSTNTKALQTVMASNRVNSYEEQVTLKPLGNGNSRRWSIDMTKPMVAQVGQLGSDYDEWVHQPVKRKETPRLFENSLLELLTRCKWWMIPLIWGPVVIWCEAKAVNKGLSVTLLPVVFTLGLLFWTLLEYILHRFLFHMKASSPIMIYMHYIIHGFHHKHPMDGDRLVFPPLYTAAICIILWKVMNLVLTAQWKPAFFGGGMLGYIIYDLTHYFLHFGTPFSNHLYKMKKEHSNHHFKAGLHNYGFGVTSSFWDRVFGTIRPASQPQPQPQPQLLLQAEKKKKRTETAAAAQLPMSM